MIPTRRNDACLAPASDIGSTDSQHHKSLCTLLTDLADPSEQDSSGFFSTHRVAARSTIKYPLDQSDTVIAIAKGWASTSVSAADGRRQILSFLLPGDIVPTGYLFAPIPEHITVAITKVTYLTFNRSEVLKRLEGRPEIFKKFLRHWIDDKDKTEKLAFTLGRGTATERVVRLIRDLSLRLSARGPAARRTIEFPLRQKHIADATGTSIVHVGKVLNELRRNGLIAISDRTLTILNEAELSHMIGR